MIEDIIKNLNDLNEVTEQEHKISQKTIQDNARAVLGEIMDCVGHHYDLNSISFRTNNWTNRKGIYIETTNNGYNNSSASISQSRDKLEWTEVDHSIRISDNINNERLTRNLEFSQVILAIISKMKTDPQLMNGFFDKMHKCFYSSEILEAKMSLINHMIDKAQKTLDVIKVDEVLNKGHLKIESSRWVQTFGSSEKLCDEVKFTKNKSGTFTTELLSEGTLISQSTRASEQNILRIISKMLDIYNFSF